MQPSTETVPPGNIALTVLRNATLKEGRFRGTAVLWYHLKQPCCDQNGSTPERGSTNDWCERAMSARQNITGRLQAYVAVLTEPCKVAGLKEGHLI